jgi:hypothetical protein
MSVETLRERERAHGQRSMTMKELRITTCPDKNLHYQVIWKFCIPYSEAKLSSEVLRHMSHMV